MGIAALIHELQRKSIVKEEHKIFLTDVTQNLIGTPQVERHSKPLGCTGSPVAGGC